MCTSFEEQYQRIKLALNVRTQMEIAETLGIRQSSISDAKRRNSVPDAWKMTLLRLCGVNPFWVETGQGPVRVEVEGGEPLTLPAFSLVATSTVDLISELVRRFPSGWAVCVQQPGQERQPGPEPEKGATDLMEATA